MKALMIRFLFLASWMIAAVLLFVHDAEAVAGAIGGYLLLSFVLAAVWVFAFRGRGRK